MPKDHRRGAEEGTEPWRFAGFALPTTTPVPDQLFDELMARLSPAELVVTLYIIRRTFGFKKPRDTISLRQLVEGIITRDGRTLDHGTGLSKATVARALNSLEATGVIIRDRNRSEVRGDEPTTYQLNFLYPLSQPETPPLSQPETPRVSATRHPVSRPRDTQETVRQETVEDVSKDTHEPQLASRSVDPSNIRKGSRQVLRENMLQRRRHVATPQRQRASKSRVSAPDDRASGSDGRGVDRMERLSAVLTACGIPVRRAAKENPSQPAEPRQGDVRTSSAPTPDYIDSVIEDISLKLGDSQHLRANLTQARHIWQASQLSVQGFVDVLYDVRRVVRFQAGVENKMAYYFKCLRVALELEENPNAAGRGRTTETTTTGKRRSLAGKYAQYVRR